MPRITVNLAISIACTALVALTACSKKDENTSEAAATDTSNTAAAAAAPDTSNTAAATPAAAPAAATPSATSIKLDIKDASGAQLSGDPESGKQVFMQCMTCHSKEPGVNKVGPSLHGIIGRHSGMIPGFNYSTANKNSGKVWTEQELYTYLENPQKEVPGTYMTYTGVKDPQKRADVIAFLQENTK
jgi:cytochrome c